MVGPNFGPVPSTAGPAQSAGTPAAAANAPATSALAQTAPLKLEKLPIRKVKPYQARHILEVDRPLDWAQLEMFALAKFRAPRWNPAPPGYVSRDVAATRSANPDEAATLRLTRHSSITGPFADPGGWGRVAYDVSCPRERWDDPPFTTIGDRDGLLRAFPAGLPNREEERVFNWLLAVASRTGGSIRCDVGNAGLPTNYVEVVLTPSPVRNVDRSVYSANLLPPDDALALVQTVLPQATLAAGESEYLGPRTHVERDLAAVNPELVDESGLSDDVRAVLHDAADQYDMAVLRKRAESEHGGLDGYGIVADLGDDGFIAVEVAAEPVVPLAVASQGTMVERGDNPVGRVRGEAASIETTGSAQPSALPPQLVYSNAASGEPWIAYRVTWFPADEVEANWEFPHSSFVATSARVSQKTNALAAALAGVVGGVLLDQNDVPLAAHSFGELAALAATSGPSNAYEALENLVGCQPD